jgi:hypothetical protein
VAVRAFDGIDPVFHNWTVTVLNKNRPPKITNTSPEQVSIIKLEQGKPATFSVKAVDPDGDPLVFAWKVNGIVVVGADAPVFTCTKGQKKGANAIIVIVSDGNATASATWTMQVTAPVITTSSSGAPVALIGIIVLAILIAVAVALLARRRGQRPPHGSPPDEHALIPPQP